jgi:hypothetical protein
LAQNKSDSGKIYSLHEPAVQCISKGKEHKKYEFGSKVSIITTNYLIHQARKKPVIRNNNCEKDLKEEQR